MDDFDNGDGYVKQQPVSVIWTSLTKKALGMKLNEHKIEFQDSIINFMGLSEPKSVKFFNADSSVDVLPDNNLIENFSV